MLMCDHTYCNTPAVRRIREIVHSGLLGELQFADSIRINLGLVQRDVNVLWDLVPHDLSIPTSSCRRAVRRRRSRPTARTRWALARRASPT